MAPGQLRFRFLGKTSPSQSWAERRGLGKPSDSAWFYTDCASSLFLASEPRRCAFFRKSAEHSAPLTPLTGPPRNTRLPAKGKQAKAKAKRGAGEAVTAPSCLLPGLNVTPWVSNGGRGSLQTTDVPPPVDCLSMFPPYDKL